MKVIVEAIDLQNLSQSPTGCLEFVIQGGAEDKATGRVTALMKAHIRLVRMAEAMDFAMNKDNQ